ncbi:hypothetical protein MMC30_002016 [Trapelia coarctata]|nr:hypothetical protein [Trapelia coarctata]
MILRTSGWLPHGLPSSFEQLVRPSSRAFSGTAIAAATQKKQRPRYADAYANKHAEARRTANMARQAVLRKQRAEALGDPIRGIPTPFIESFDTALPTPSESSAAEVETSPDGISATATETETPPTAPSSARINTAAIPQPPNPETPLLNHFLTSPELEAALSTSRALTTPQVPASPSTADPMTYHEATSKHASAHDTASTALSRILDLSNASSRHRTRANTRRCIATFGRHVTDTFLRPKPLNKYQLAKNVNPADTDTPTGKTPRAGADTGSSEVQIAILTAKVRVLADRYEGVNRNDKVNKRNLRLLLHRRQKLLKYMERKERGGERWQYMLGTLGLTEATWKGQLEVR